MPYVCWRYLSSRLKRLVYGATDWRAGGCESVFNIVNNHWLNHQTQIRAGVLEDECSLLVKNSFKLDVKITIEVSLVNKILFLEKFYKIKGIFTF